MCFSLFFPILPHTFRAAIRNVLTGSPIVRRAAFVGNVDETGEDQFGELRFRILLRQTKRESKVVDARQRAVRLAGDAEQIDPSLEKVRRKPLNLGII